MEKLTHHERARCPQCRALLVVAAWGPEGIDLRECTTIGCSVAYPADGSLRLFSIEQVEEDWSCCCYDGDVVREVPVLWGVVDADGVMTRSNQ